MISFTPAPLTALAIDAAIAAAEVICTVYNRPIAVETKGDGSPVTEADGAAEAVILAALTPTGIPVLAEESAAAGSIPELGDEFFVVDPLDGTKEFIKRNGEFTVNIALVKYGFPTMGVVLAPATGEIYVGDAQGAWRGVIDGKAIVDRTLLSVKPAQKLRVVASRSHGHAALQDLCAALAIEEDVSVGSSLKFCLLAANAAELYPRFTPTSEWDTAAGQAVLEAAGGAVLTLDGSRLSYKKLGGNFINPYFVAATSNTLAKDAAARMVSALKNTENA